MLVILIEKKRFGFRNSIIGTAVVLINSYWMDEVFVRCRIITVEVRVNSRAEQKPNIVLLYMSCKKTWGRESLSHACRITHVSFAGSGQSIAFSGQEKRWTAYSSIILASQLQKNRGTCCDAELTYC